MENAEVKIDEATGLPVLDEGDLFWVIDAVSDNLTSGDRPLVRLKRIRVAEFKELTFSQKWGRIFLNRIYLMDDQIGSWSAPVKEYVKSYWTDEDHGLALSAGWAADEVVDGEVITYTRSAKAAVTAAALEVYETYRKSQIKSDLDELVGTYTLTGDPEKAYVKGEIK